MNERGWSHLEVRVFTPREVWRVNNSENWMTPLISYLRVIIVYGFDWMQSRIADSFSEVHSYKKIEMEWGVGAANRQPRPLHRGRRYPQKTPEISVEGSGSPIGGPDPKSTRDL
ncbi:hypothetical protein CRG98_042666 [Punica granatum]|uniref:Uncharacterized protein n=1 Tax=Punica granatum TaxID=22663 RepID=A0A2I0HZ28_PUNGR|nr:hypothetical protein CRG98_042666 [Punica granatum]